MNVSCVKADITRFRADAIVNAANTSLRGGGGVDGAIHRAGGPSILEECKTIRDKQGGCPTGDAVITTAGRLPAKKLIHTVGPVWEGGGNGEMKLLRSCYTKCLALAESHAFETIAFPNISTGVYNFTKETACQIAIDTIRNYESDVIQEVVFVCFDEENYRLYEKALET